MNEEELNAIIDKMIADGSSDDEIRAKLTELRSQPASTSEPEEAEPCSSSRLKRLQQKIGSVVSIATDYWKNQKVPRTTVAAGLREAPQLQRYR